MRFKTLTVSGDIVNSALKRFPSNNVGQDLKARLRDGGYRFKLHYDDKEMWLGVGALWAEHCYSIEAPATIKRFRELITLVNSWN